MAKMRATLRKVAQVTPPPSPKNGEEIKAQPTEWTSRLRNHIKTCESKKSPDSCSRRVQIKKENPGLPQEEYESKTCSTLVTRQRNLSGDAINYWGPRRSARLIGIPADVEGCCRESAAPEKETKYPRTKRKSVSSEGDCCCYQIPLVSCKLRSSDGIIDNQDVCSVESECQLEPSHTESSSCLPLKKRKLPPIDQLDMNGTDSSVSDPSLDDSETSRIETECPTESTPKVNGHVPLTKDKGKNCKKSRTIEALLVESERFMQYPSKATSRSRSTYNSRDIRPPSASPVPFVTQESVVNTSPPRSTCLANVNQVEFSFEIVPTRAVWYRTFLRDECEATRPPEAGPSSSEAAPFLLPYEMSLETILKSNRAVRQQKKRQKSPRKPPQAPQFRPIISTRLQMQTAARQSQIQERELKTAAAAVASNGPATREENHRRKKAPWRAMPRKSPRCHASTLAILCSKQGTPTPQEESAADEDLQTTAEQGDGLCNKKMKLDSRLASIVEEESAESNLDRLETTTCSESEQEGSNIISVWERMITRDLGRTSGSTTDPAGSSPRKRKRGRPRKRSTASDREALRMARLLSTPLDRIEDIVDERIVHEMYPESVPTFDDDGSTLLDSVPEFLGSCHSNGDVDGTEQQRNVTEVCLTKAEVLQQVLQSIALDLQSDRCSSSTNSIYETASDLGSTSTTASGTCHSRKKWRRRKRNMTGWPRSKKRKPPNNYASDVSEMSNDGTASLSGSDAPYLSPCRELLVDNAACSEPTNLTTIHEESSSKDSPAASQMSTEGGSPSSRVSRDNQPQLTKPFQFQRKTLKFVGKRILRQKRHAPQRLEYWPRFASANESRKRRRRKS